MAEPKAECQIIGGIALVILALLAWLLTAGRSEE
jgi:hypothetical protein